MSTDHRYMLSAVVEIDPSDAGAFRVGYRLSANAAARSGLSLGSCWIVDEVRHEYEGSSRAFVRVKRNMLSADRPAKGQIVRELLAKALEGEK